MHEIQTGMTVASPETIPMSQDHNQSTQERLARTELPLGQWEPLPAPSIIPVSQRPREADFGKTLHCLEVLKAVQGDTRTAGWYWGDVRGKAAVGAATAALLNKGLIHSVVGPPPFRLTARGEEFIEAHRKDWEAFLANTDRQGTIERFANALRQIPEESRAVESL